MPMPIRSSELKSSSASCCVMPIRRSISRLISNQVYRIVGSHDAFAQHRGIDAGAPVVLTRDFLQNDRRTLGRFGIERDDHAAAIFFHRVNGHLLANPQRPAHQLVFVKRFIALPAHIEVRAKPSRIERQAGFLRYPAYRGQAENRDGRRIRHGTLRKARPERMAEAPLQILREVRIASREFLAFRSEHFGGVTLEDGAFFLDGRRIKKARAQQQPLARLARGHPGKGGLILLINERIHAIADDSSECDARGRYIFTRHALYRITTQRGEGSDALHAITLRGERWTAMQTQPATPQIPVVENAESARRPPLFHNRDSGRRDIPAPGRNECCRPGSAPAPAAAYPV